MKIKITDTNDTVLRAYETIGFDIEVITEMVPESFKESEPRVISILTQAGVADRYIITKANAESLIEKFMADTAVTIKVDEEKHTANSIA